MSRAPKLLAALGLATALVVAQLPSVATAATSAPSPSASPTSAPTPATTPATTPTVTPSTSAPAATGVSTSGFVAGGASGTSQVLQVAPRDAGLAATVTIGQSIADYRDSLAQASSQALDLGLVGSNLTVQCSSLPPPVTAGDLPKPITAESDTGNAQSSRTVAGPSTQSLTAAAGREQVAASPAPNEAATASFDGERVVLPGVLTVAGLSSHAHARLVAGKARIATASADVGSLNLLGGKVVLDGLHWSITQNSGTHDHVKRSFTIGSASIAGTKLPTTSASVDGTLASVNKALAKTGLHVSMPALTKEDGVYAVTPLSVGIDNSQLGAELLDPVLNLLHTLIDPTMATITNAVCQVGSVYGTINLLLTGLNGVGAIDVELGGTTASTNHTTYADPFGSGGLGTSPSLGGGASTLPGGGLGTAGGGAGATPPTLPGVSSVPTVNQTPQVAGTRDLSASCSTTSPAGRPGCSRGAGLAVGLIALATLGGVAAADYVVSRRRRKLARMAIQ